MFRKLKRGMQEDVPSQTHDTSVYLKTSISAVPSCDDCTSNWLADERCKRHNAEECASPHTNLSDIGDLCYQRPGHTYERATAEAEDDCEHDL